MKMNQNQTNYLKSAFLPLFLAGLCLFALFFFFWESLPAAATDQNIPAPETTFHFREEVVSLMDLDSQTVQVVTVSGAVYQINQETGLKQIEEAVSLILFGPGHRTDHRGRILGHQRLPRGA